MFFQVTLAWDLYVNSATISSDSSRRGFTMTCAILIVDRDPHWTEKVSNAFVPYLVRVHTASMAKSALSIIRNSSLDLVVLDAGIVSIEMYSMNLHRRTRPKLIVTSSVRDFGMAVDSLRVGASDIFLRPVSLRDLIRRATRELDGRIASPHYLARRLDGFSHGSSRSF